MANYQTVAEMPSSLGARKEIPHSIIKKPLDDSTGDPSEPPNAEDLALPAHPDFMDVYMPPVDMEDFAHYGFAFVDPESPNNGALVCGALLTYVHRGHEARMATSAYGAHLIAFRTPQSRLRTTLEGPFPFQEHTVWFEHHEHAENRSCFEHRGFVSLSLVGYPVENWNRRHIQCTVSGSSNPSQIEEFCLTGAEFTAVVIMGKYDDYHAIPDELHVKRHDGVITFVDVFRVRCWDIGKTSDDDPPHSPQYSGGAWGLGAGGGGGPGGSPDGNGAGPASGGRSAGAGPSRGTPFEPGSLSRSARRRVRRDPSRP
jgi:hypothetical protein